VIISAHEERDKMVKEGEKCLQCAKKFTKSDYSLQCTVCGLWIHKVCSGVTDDLFKFLDQKLTGTAYWACRPCTVYAQGMNHRLKQMEEKLNRV
jgi:hypothetical protein